MKKVIRLTESDLVRIVKRVISEQPVPFNVSDATKVQNTPPLIDVKKEHDYYLKKRSLTPNGCTQVRYVGPPTIKSGACIKKNTEKLKSSLHKNMYPGFPDYPGIADNAKNVKPDFYISGTELETTLVGKQNRIYFFCDKSKSPLNEKSHIFMEYLKWYNNPHRKRYEYFSFQNEDLEVAFKKHFCSPK